mmetsp:Transcript_23281/g.75289  ORF Transcript_23281/g.75289 Transcript_23281/m.75289 type:complete len:285 (-) Transcript_23281:263-1117(-)
MVDTSSQELHLVLVVKNSFLEAVHRDPAVLRRVRSASPRVGMRPLAALRQTMASIANVAAETLDVELVECHRLPVVTIFGNEDADWPCIENYVETDIDDFMTPIKRTRQPSAVLASCQMQEGDCGGKSAGADPGSFGSTVAPAEPLFQTSCAPSEAVSFQDSSGASHGQRSLRTIGASPAQAPAMQEDPCPTTTSACGVSSELDVFGGANQDDSIMRNKRNRHCKAKRDRYRKLITSLVETKTADPKAYVELLKDLPPSISKCQYTRTKLQEAVDKLSGESFGM